MKIFLPLMLQLFKQLIEDNSASSVLLQKQLLKILYALVQVRFHLRLIKPFFYCRVKFCVTPCMIEVCE